MCLCLAVYRDGSIAIGPISYGKVTFGNYSVENQAFGKSSQLLLYVLYDDSSSQLQHLDLMQPVVALNKASSVLPCE